MEKRAYTAPHVEVCTIGVVNMIAESVNRVSSSNVFKNTTVSGSSGSARARRRRDTWDNGWED